MRAATRAALAVATIALALPAIAGADFSGLYGEYRDFGLVDGCAHPEADLRQALEDIPPDIRAYDPGFGDALGGALEQRALGCDPESGPAENPDISGIAIAADGSPGPAGAAPLAASEAGDAGPPAALIALLAALAGALLAAIVLLAADGRSPAVPGALRRAWIAVRGARERLADIAVVLRRRIGF
jgi:hypothetical protein